jgi:Protein of unknown function (DUF3887)
MRRAFTVIAGALALCACSIGESIPKAESAITDFHKKIDAAQFDAIYQGASGDMKNSTTQKSLVDLLSAVGRKLGKFQSGKTVGWNESRNTNGHFVTLNYSATYERGTADENFVYRINGDRVLLAGYHVNSNALIVN